MNIIRKNLLILSIILVFSLLGVLTGGIIFATDNIPNLVIGGRSNKIEPIFTEDLGEWYPGHYVAKTLKVKNNQKLDSVIKNISMGIDLSKDNSTIDLESIVGKEYLDSMELKIELKDKKIFKKPYNQILYDGNFKDFLSGINPNIKIEGKENLDLIYTIGMKESASVNIEGIDGSIDFIFLVQQNFGSDSEQDIDKDEKAKMRRIGLVDKETPKKEDIEGYWAHDCILILLEKGIIKGYPDGSIKAENYITRGEASVLVGRSIGVEKLNTVEIIYRDRLPNWASNYILALTDLGVLEGYDDGCFRANNYITREEMVKLLVLTFEKEIINVSELKFLDKDEIGNWAVNYVKFGAANNIIEGYPDGTFRPRDNITRGETFTILCKLLNLHKEHGNR